MAFFKVEENKRVRNRGNKMNKGNINELFGLVNC